MRRLRLTLLVACMCLSTSGLAMPIGGFPTLDAAELFLTEEVFFAENSEESEWVMPLLKKLVDDAIMTSVRRQQTGSPQNARILNLLIVLYKNQSLLPNPIAEDVSQFMQGFRAWAKNGRPLLTPSVMALRVQGRAVVRERAVKRLRLTSSAPSEERLITSEENYFTAPFEARPIFQKLQKPNRAVVLDILDHQEIGFAQLLERYQSSIFNQIDVLKQQEGFNAAAFFEAVLHFDGFWQDLIQASVSPLTNSRQQPLIGPVQGVGGQSLLDFSVFSRIFLIKKMGSSQKNPHLLDDVLHVLASAKNELDWESKPNQEHDARRLEWNQKINRHRQVLFALFPNDWRTEFVAMVYELGAFQRAEWQASSSDPSMGVSFRTKSLITKCMEELRSPLEEGQQIEVHPDAELILILLLTLERRVQDSAAQARRFHLYEEIRDRVNPRTRVLNEQDLCEWRHRFRLINNPGHTEFALKLLEHLLPQDTLCLN